MKHIKLIKDEQLLEQISGGRALAVAGKATFRSPIKTLVANFVMELRSILHPKDRVATYSKI